MPDKEILQRVTRIEAKLDILLPQITEMPTLKNDVTNIKRAVGLLGTIVGVLGTWAATYLGSKR